MVNQTREISVSDDKSEIIPVTDEFSSQALLTKQDYEKLYKQSIEHKEAFWQEQAQAFLTWSKPFTKVMNTSFEGDVDIKWFEDGELNVCYNCVDRHLPERASQTAIIWEADSPEEESTSITYQQLYNEVNRFSLVLKSLGVNKGDRVVLYMPMIVEAAYAMLACARIGAIHSVVFAGFSPEALRGRIEDCGATCVITADEGRRGGKTVPLKENVDQALRDDSSVRNVLVVRHTGGEIRWNDKRDAWYHQIGENVSGECAPEVMSAEDPLFILYTSGSTGKPKGVLHTTAGYLLFAAMTHRYSFDYHDGDVYWCTADIGWVTGHSYIIYGPLANGAITLMYEGVPNYPDVSRCWNIVDKHQVNIFYTAPTAIRALMAHGNEPVMQTSRASLRVLGTVGEPINPEAWRWYWRVVGESRCPVVDTWWQTETGGHLITPLPGAVDLKPGSASLPFLGIEPVIVDAEGRVLEGELEGEAEGALCFLDSWPGQMRTVYGDHERFIETYFKPFPGKYFSGDGAKRDKDGYYWITGRMDDVLNVSGHRLGTAEIESALVLHENVCEAAVVGYPHEIKGEAIYAYITVNEGVRSDDALRKALMKLVRDEIGPIAQLDSVQFVSGLPKTRSGKIMRRILRKIAHGDDNNFGDTNTLLNPDVLQELIEGRINT